MVVAAVIGVDRDSVWRIQLCPPARRTVGGRCREFGRDAGLRMTDGRDEDQGGKNPMNTSQLRQQRRVEGSAPASGVS